jgi:hypothetical protein
MAHVITFRSARFDLDAERPNPINPIPGEGVLRWLREKLAGNRYETTEPAPEDWGWYIDVTGDGAAYLVGASGDAVEESPGDVDWTIQVHRHRSLRDKLTGRNKLTAADPVSSLIERLLVEEGGMRGVAVEREP